LLSRLEPRLGVKSRRESFFRSDRSDDLFRFSGVMLRRFSGVGGVASFV